MLVRANFNFSVARNKVELSAVKERQEALMNSALHACPPTAT